MTKQMALFFVLTGLLFSVGFSIVVYAVSGPLHAVGIGSMTFATVLFCAIGALNS